MGVKEKDLASVSTMGSSDYLRCVTSAGDSKKIYGTNFAARRLDISTSTPTSDNTNGYRVCLLASEPGTKYDGWIYLIKE